MRRIITILAIILLTVVCYSCNSKDDAKARKKSENMVVGEFKEEINEGNTSITKDIDISDNTTSVSAVNSSEEAGKTIPVRKERFDMTF